MEANTRHCLTTVAILLIRWKVGATLLLSELTYTAAYMYVAVFVTDYGTRLLIAEVLTEPFLDPINQYFV